MTGFSNPIIGGGGALVYPAIHSPNFKISPLTGWSIDKDGNAYFADITAGGTISGATISGATIEGSTITGTTIDGSQFIGFNVDGAVLIYDGSVPAKGNLIFSVSEAAYVDPLGNNVLQGQAAYDTSGNVAVSIMSPGSGGLIFWQGTNAWGPWFDQAAIELIKDANSNWDLLLEALSGGSIVLSGPVTAPEPGANLPEAWHNMTPAAGFAVGSPVPQYRLEPVGGGLVRLRGQITLTANKVAGATFFTMPTGYVPAEFWRAVTENTLSGSQVGTGTIQVNSAGQLQIQVAGTNGNAFELHNCAYPLD